MTNALDRDALVWVGTAIPGNGTKYDYAVWQSQGEWFVALPEFRRSARIGVGNHWSYIMEKLDISKPDAEVMADIINEIQELQ